MPPKPEDKNGESVDKRIDGLTKAFGDMAGTLEALPQQIGESVTRSISGLVDRERTQQRDTKDTKDDDPPPNATELEKLSRPEFADHMMKQLGKVLDSKLKPFQDSLSTNIEANEREKVIGKFEAVRKAHPDFDEWKEEMGKLVETRGYLDPEELYILVRARNSEKAKQVDEAITKKEADTSKLEEEKASAKVKEKSEPAFLGLLPTSSAAKEGEPEYKTSKEAASAAFDELMGGIDESLIGESSQT